jgi:hypothetical protein
MIGGSNSRHKKSRRAIGVPGDKIAAWGDAPGGQWRLRPQRASADASQGDDN